MKIVKDNVYRPKRAIGGRLAPVGYYRVVALEGGRVKFEALTNSGERAGGGIMAIDKADFERLIEGGEE